MTVNSSNTRELNINKIVLRAINAAALLPAGAAQSGPQWDALASQARDFLEMEVDSIQASGVIARAVEFYDVPLTEGVATYNLPADTFDLAGDSTYVPASLVGETPVKSVPRNDYMLIADKTARGRPTLLYAEMHETIKLYLWPVPDTSETLRIQRYKLLADNDDGTRTVDLQRHWTKYLMFAVAHMLKLSSGASPASCGYLRTNADSFKKEAMSASSERTPEQIVCTHSSPWEGR